MISIPPLPSIVSEAFNSSVCWKVNVSAADEPTILRAPVAVEALIVVPAASFLIWVSQKDALQRGR